MPAHGLAVTDVGWKARRLLEGTPAVSLVAALSRSLYVEIAGEIAWLGPPGSTLHGRAILADEFPGMQAHARIDVTFDLSAAREWRPPRLDSVDVEGLRDAGRRLASMIDRLGAPDGFGALLADRRPAFPLDRAEEDARGFLAACARGEASTALRLAERLLGLGPGLTPAGDDLVGGALFASTLPSAPHLLAGLRTIVEPIRARAAERTHRISATLLGDLLEGDGYAPLHDLACALAGDDDGGALDASTRLIRIGHSSGWDILAGVLGALDALPAPRRPM